MVNLDDSFVLPVGVGDGLPLHIEWIISNAAVQGLDVVDEIALA